VGSTGRLLADLFHPHTRPARGGSEMPVTVACPHCKARLVIPSKKLGEPIRCPACSGTVKVRRGWGDSRPPPAPEKAPTIEVHAHSAPPLPREDGPPLPSWWIAKDGRSMGPYSQREVE